MKKIKTTHSILLLYLFLIIGINNSMAQLVAPNWKYTYKYGGTGTAGYSGAGGVSTSANINFPFGMVFDKTNNLYFSDYSNHVIRRIDAITGIISVVAGTPGTSGFFGDGGLATSSLIKNPRSIAIDPQGNLYFVDVYRVRKINMATGIITTIAGNGFAATCCDGGPATSAMMNPIAVTVDPSGIIYILEQSCIRRVDPITNIITTIAGTTSSSSGHSGDGGLATLAEIGPVNGLIKADAIGNLYFTEDIYNCVRKIDVTSGIITTVAGVPSFTYGHSGDGGPAISAQLSIPKDIEFDAFGNLYISEFFNSSGVFQNCYIRKVTSGGTISTIAGTGNVTPNAMCNDPKLTSVGAPISLAMNNDGNLFIADFKNPRILLLSEGLKIKDVDINTRCATGFSIPAVIPKFTVTMSGGVPPYNYTWSTLASNNATLSSMSSANPLVTAISNPYLANFNLSVTDNASCGNSATRKVSAQFNTAPTFDLAMRDSYYDMLDEPNSQAIVDPDKWDIWYSQDLWNRLKQDDKLSPQDPCSGTSCTNYMYATVRNVGCRTSPVSIPEAGGGPPILKFYWSMGGTRQIWPGNWTTGIHPPSGLPQGLQIASIPLPAIAPGQKQQFNANWTPPIPFLYFPGENSMLTCFLGRIVDYHNSFTTDGMTFEEVPELKTNLNNNNNIVMRNSKVIRINNYSPRTFYLTIGNSDNVARVFSLEFLNSTDGGSTLDQFATVTLSLGPVFDAWVNGGAIGTYSQVDYNNKTVTFDGTSTMTLSNILFGPGEEHFIGLEFAMLTGVDGTEMQNETIHFRQLFTNQNVTEVYGDYNFLVVFDGQTAGPIPGPALDIDDQKISSANGIKVYPNPSSTVFNFDLNTLTTGTLTLMDATGRIVSEQKLENQKILKIDVRLLQSGIYFYKIQTNNDTKSGSVIIGK